MICNFFSKIVPFMR